MSALIERLARRLVFDSSRAEDIVQATWLEALERPPRDGSNLRGWQRGHCLQRRYRRSSVRSEPSSPVTIPCSLADMTNRVPGGRLLM